MKQIFIGIVLSAFTLWGFAQPESIVESRTADETGGGTDDATTFDLMNMVYRSDQEAMTPEQLAAAKNTLASILANVASRADNSVG